jgi:hypothetical protein
VRAYCLARVADALAGRTVWCAPALRAALEGLLGERAVVRTHSDALVGPDDIVVLDGTQPAPSVREQGAHVVVRASMLPGSRASAVDAYLISWTATGALACRLSAIMPNADRVAEKDMRGHGDDLAWGSVLADVVDADRDEHVGGRRHVRPAVAVH